jgi:hypothetical protein
VAKKRTELEEGGEIPHFETGRDAARRAHNPAAQRLANTVPGMLPNPTSDNTRPNQGRGPSGHPANSPRITSPLLEQILLLLSFLLLVEFTDRFRDLIKF